MLDVEIDLVSDPGTLRLNGLSAEEGRYGNDQESKRKTGKHNS